MNEEKGPGVGKRASFVKRVKTWLATTYYHDNSDCRAALSLCIAEPFFYKAWQREKTHTIRQMLPTFGIGI